IQANALNFGGTVGYQGILYEVYNTPLQSDMIHLGDRTLVANGARNWSGSCQTGTSTNNNGLSPIWLNDNNQTTPQTSSMTSLNAVFGPNTRIGILYHVSDVPTAAVQKYATFDVTLAFTDSTSVTVRVQATDWFGTNTQVLPDALPGSGLEKQ